MAFANEGLLRRVSINKCFLSSKNLVQLIEFYLWSSGAQLNYISF